ncbi:MAG: F0F1 ATP synthase subunit delta, partial [Planctomycetota bacterium]|nr:F0F1 ATP synthase subunit delta [Planctomycetota bacterium]
MTLLAGRYARALFEVAESRGAVDAVAADLAAIDEILS